MILNDGGHEEFKKTLRLAFPPFDLELRRDLWPAMLHRLKERERNAPVPWHDWALVGALAVILVFFPSLLLVFAYHL